MATKQKDKHSVKQEQQEGNLGQKEAQREKEAEAELSKMAETSPESSSGPKDTEQ
jgi:hypothetical protein